MDFDEKELYSKLVQKHRMNESKHQVIFLRHEIVFMEVYMTNVVVGEVVLHWRVVQTLHHYPRRVRPPLPIPRPPFLLHLHLPLGPPRKIGTQEAQMEKRSGF